MYILLFPRDPMAIPCQPELPVPSLAAAPGHPASCHTSHRAFNTQRMSRLWQRQTPHQQQRNLYHLFLNRTKWGMSQKTRNHLARHLRPSTGPNSRRPVRHGQHWAKLCTAGLERSFTSPLRLVVHDWKKLTRWLGEEMHPKNIFCSLSPSL